MKFPSSVVFDFDGTLYDPSIGISEALNESLKFEYPQALPYVPSILQSIGPPIGEMLRPYIADAKIIHNVTKNFRRLYDNKFCVLGNFYQGIIPALADLKGAGLSVSIFTNKPHKALCTILQHYSLIELFDFAYCIDYPRQYSNKSLMLADLISESCSTFPIVVFGDSESDRIAALENNCLFYGDLQKKITDSFLPTLNLFISSLL